MTTNSTNRIAKNNQKLFESEILGFVPNSAESFHFSGTNMTVWLARNIFALETLLNTVKLELDGTASEVNRDTHDLSLLFYRVYIYIARPFSAAIVDGMSGR